MSDVVQKSIEANIEVHSTLADQYNTEPHFRPENIAKVERRLAEIVRETGATDMLDLGCGTGFMIDIARPHVKRIVGVDVTEAMLAKVDTETGPASVELVTHDTGTYEPEAGAFQVVTAYSFLHHLADVVPTLRTAAKALKSGGRFYADLDPNGAFWASINGLERGGDYHPLVQREVEAVTYKDEEIQEKFGVSAETFNLAEYGKDVAGGFHEDKLRAQLLEAGFSSVEFHYEWFLGEGFLINSDTAPREQLLRQAAQVTEVLQRALPVSRNMFKYLGFVATK